MEVIKSAWICCKDGSAVPIALYREEGDKKFICIDLDKIYSHMDKSIEKVAKES